MHQSHAELPYQLEDTYILQFGNFYFYEKFVISEIEEGVNFNAEKADMVMKLIVAHYGTCKYLGYISNRINEYTVSKDAWNIFAKSSRFNGYATVPKVKESFWNKFKNIGKISAKNQSFTDLLEAASWLTSLNILIKNKKVQKRYISPLQNRSHIL